MMDGRLSTRRIIAIAGVVLLIGAGMSFAPAISAQNGDNVETPTPTREDGTFVCDDFDTREQLNAVFDPDDDVNNLDADDDGNACEGKFPPEQSDNSGSETATSTDEPTETETATEATTATATAETTETAATDKEANTATTTSEATEKATTSTESTTTANAKTESQDTTTVNKTAKQNETAYYQVDFVARNPIYDLQGPNGSYSNGELIRFAHGSSDQPITRRSEGEFTTNDTLAERIDSQNITVENGTATTTFTVSEGESVTLSLVSYTKPEAKWSRETEHLQKFIDADTRTFDSGTHTLTVDLPNESNQSETGGQRECTLPNPNAETADQIQKLRADNGSESDFFGRSVAIDGNTTVVGAPSAENDSGNDTGAAYVYNCQGEQNVQTQKLVASDGAADDSFGFSAAIDSDIMIIGAPDDSNDNGKSAGAAYVFERQKDGEFAQTQKLTASNGSNFSDFASTVAVQGDTIVIGANEEDNENGDVAGTVYVFKRNDTDQFTQSQRLLADNGASTDFGRSVALQGDTLVIGTAVDSNNSETAGAAYVFKRNSTSQFTQSQKLTIDNVMGVDPIYVSVAIEGDTIVMGAQNEHNAAGDQAGAAYVFEQNSTDQFTQTQKLTASDASVGDGFGRSVAIDENTIVIGATGVNTNGSSSGAAYVFKRNSTDQFTQNQKLTAEDDTGSSTFGVSVAIQGNTIVIGNRDNYGGKSAGAAYVFN